MEPNHFQELTVILAIGAAVAIVMRLIKQPLIIGHILTGIIVGPSVFALIHSPETFEIFAKLGITLLLFIVGLGLNPRVIREMGKVSFLTGCGQVLFTSLFGYIILLALGFDKTTSVYMAVALSFSSTIIVLKLLSDKKEQHKLHGRISIGFLLVQDIIATFALVAASAAGKGGLDLRELGILAGTGILLAALLYVLAISYLPKLVGFLSSSQELLFIFALAWAFGVGAIFSALGFSLEVGALFAGIALASTPFAAEISARLRPLRDFFIVVFFISLGSSLALDNIVDVLPVSIILSLFILVGNPIIVMAILGFLGYTKKTSFKTSLAVAQVSEFSLIFLLIGNENGQVADRAMTVLTIIALITFALSSYMIIYSDQLYRLVERYLRMFERRKVHFEQESAHHYDVVLLGYRKGGWEFVRTLRTAKKKHIVVDYDPEIIDRLDAKNIPFVYGDATDIELLQEIGVGSAKFIFSTISDLDTNRTLLEIIKGMNKDAVFICNADDAKHATQLYELGASYVMIPHYLGSEKISSFIKHHGLKSREFKRYREEQLAYLHTHYLESV